MGKTTCIPWGTFCFFKEDPALRISETTPGDPGSLTQAPPGIARVITHPGSSGTRPVYSLRNAGVFVTKMKLNVI